MGAVALAGDVVRHFFHHDLTVTIGLVIGLPLTIAGNRLVEASVVGFTLERVAAVVSGGAGPDSASLREPEN